MESDKRGKKKIRTERYKGEKMGKEESKREGGGSKGERKRVVQLVLDEAERGYWVLQKWLLN